ncbi:ABC-2 family transporter protein [Planctomycetes bacterium Poly30]|uniref:ABC-2 family transporter protein n=1 Tax=Saltatorellus ferox TaxID=2528018 RepID=A0A518EV98_9BACT|nr:ABC-2 family transporter protein [Planctomycetes bacterium Poly30]
MRIAMHVLRTELLQLARDKRALFSAVVLPAILYPIFFWGSGKLETVGRETMAAREVTIRADLDSLSASMRDELTAALSDAGPTILEDLNAEILNELASAEADAEGPSKELRDAARALLSEPRSDAAPPAGGGSAGESADAQDQGADLLLIATVDGEDPDRNRASFDLWFDVKSDDAREARSRVRTSLETLETLEVERRRDRLLGGDPARALEAEPVDMATVEDQSGAALGKWLPFIALLVLISGGAYAALAVFAGEREAGTLETLLVQPVPHTSIATGKFLAVFVAGFATLVVNLASLVACVSLGLADMDAMGGGEGGVGLMRMAALIVEVPACLLLCAVLCLVCGGAKTFREGQLLVFPVTLLVIVPTSIVLRPEATLTAFWAFVPFAGSALALRDGLEGDLRLSLAALVMVTHVGWTWLALSRLGRVLDAERILGGGGDSKSEGHLNQAAARHAVRWGFAVVMTVYLIAGSVQRWDMKLGMWFTFWMLLPAFALVIAWTTPRRKQLNEEEEPRDLIGRLGLRPQGLVPLVAHVLGALLLVPMLARGALALGEWQRDVLPMPAGVEKAMEGMGGLLDMGTGWLFFFLAFSPAIFEELVFRGALLSAMRRDWRWPKIIGWQALYFALVHASVYRLLPTGILGALLAGLTLRARCVYPAIALHMGYNGLLVLGSNDDGTTVLDAGWFAYAPYMAAVGLGLIALVSTRRDSVPSSQ